MKDGCNADLSELKIPDSTKIGPPPETLAGSMRAWDLRKLRNVVIPEGAEKIGSCWFWRTDVESVEISGSVREIGANAFFSCEKLEMLTFKNTSATSSEDENESNVQKGLRIIGARAFCGCRNLSAVEFPNGLEEIGFCAF